MNNGDTAGLINDCWTTNGGWVQFQWEKAVTVGAMKVWYTRFRTLQPTYCLHRCAVQWWDGGDWQTDQLYDDQNSGVNQDHDIILTEPRKTTRLRLYNMWAGANVKIQEWQVFPGRTGSLNAPNGSVYIFEGSAVLNPSYNVSFGGCNGGYSNIITNSLNNSGLAMTDLDLGDINGDGYKDILIGSGGIEYSGLGSGGVEVVFGGDGLPEVIDLAYYPHVNITSFPEFDLSLVTHADMNGDGCDEIIVNAPGCFFDETGAVFIFNGSELFAPGEYSILYDHDIMFRGPSKGWDMGVPTD